MEGNARPRFTPKQKAELWDRWRNGQCIADIARALERNGARARDCMAVGAVRSEPVSQANSL